MSNKGRIAPTRSALELPPDVRRMLAEAEQAKAQQQEEQQQQQQQVTIVERIEYPSANFGFEFHDNPPRIVLSFLTPVGPGAGKETKFPFAREVFPVFVAKAQEFIEAVEKVEAEAEATAAAQAASEEAA